jgi:hypothetical protein
MDEFVAPVISLRTRGEDLHDDAWITRCPESRKQVSAGESPGRKQVSAGGSACDTTSRFLRGFLTLPSSYAIEKPREMCRLGRF